jgi:uncharacterized protein YdeI (YjbR/CyaY-like superfamily)
LVKPPDPSEVKVFPSAAELRRWFETHHATDNEVWVGYYKKGVPKQSVSYMDAVDEGLCFGWVDSVGYRVDDEVYTNRFTPRRKGSNWSTRNVARVGELIVEGRMHPAGLAAFEQRREDRTGIYSYENRPRDLPSEYLQQLRSNPAAWHFWQAQTSSYRRGATWWVVSAKQEVTRQRRLETLIEDAAAGRKIKPMLVGRDQQRRQARGS